MKNTALLSLLIILAMTALVLAGCGGVTEVPAEDTYSYSNPEEIQAVPDEGMVIDGVLDEEVYQNNNWLYLHNDDGGNDVNIAMTSYYGEKGMYIVYDVTETVPIYVNPNRSPVMNSCIEMYLAPPYLATIQDNSVFEIDLMPTGDMSFRKSNGQYAYTNVITTNENMAVLGATTKGGEVNTPECYGYCLELFIPWDYMTWLDIDADAMRSSFVYINPAHITSNNYEGTNTDLDRYWYYYAQQQGADFSNVFQYFRFNGDGVIGAKPVTIEGAENCVITGQKSIMPGMISNITIAPKEGFALTSILANGQEQIQKVSYNEDGSVTLEVRASNDGLTVKAKAEPIAEGNKTLSGKIVINSMAGGTLEDVLAYYVGPTGEKPVEFDSNGNFEHKDLAPGYYTIKVEKEGFTSISRGICLNQDVYTELTLEYEMLQATYGTCWILDEMNDGVLHKFGGSGQVMSQQSYNSFTVSANLKYDDELQKQGTNDFFTQQRSGIRVQFSNGKYWHINLLKEGDKYILQYGRHTGEASVFNWKTIHTLTEEEAALYRSDKGLQLQIMRQGRHCAVWLNGKLLVIELLGEEYASYTATVGMEAWVANRTIMEIPFKLSAGVPVDVAGSAFHWPAEIWDISNQYNGTVSKLPAPGKDTWLDGKLNITDVTTTARDHSPETNDFCLVYIFKFSNGENFRVRLNHTDDDGAYRIQSFANSTLFAPWKNHYTLTNEQAAKVMGDGIDYRVQILGTTAYVYLDDVPVCTYDLSTVVATGKPSGIEDATCTVSFRMDGNTNCVTVLPYEMSYDPDAEAPDMSGTTQVITQKEHNDFTYEVNLKYDTELAQQGDTDLHNQQRSGVKVTFTEGKNWHIHLLREGDACYVQYAAMSGDNSLYNWSNIRTLTEEEVAAYESEEGITLKVMRQGNFAAVWLGGTLLRVEKLDESYADMTAKLSLESWVEGKTSSDMSGTVTESVPYDLSTAAFYWPTETWDISGQYDGYFSKLGVAGNTTWADSLIPVNDVTTTARDMSPETNDYCMVYIFKFSNGENFRVRLNHTDNDGAYRIQSFANSTLFEPWKNHYTLTDEQAAKVMGEGIDYRVQILGTTAYVYLDDVPVCTYDLSTVVATGEPSGIEDATATVSFRMDGNVDMITDIPFRLAYDTSAQPVAVNIAGMLNGTVTADKSLYMMGETVTLTVSPNEGYSQKLFINGEPLLLDWKTNTYSFVATEEAYAITGSFEPSLSEAPSDAARWDGTNQAHGHITTYYPDNTNSWWYKINGEYESVAVTAKNYLPMAESGDGSGDIGYSFVLAATLDNGSTYAFRIINEKENGTGGPRYIYTRYGASGSVTGWSGWCLLEAKAPGVTDKLQGDGAEFALTRNSANTLQITLDGVVLDTYTMDGVTSANKVVSVGMYHFGNKGQYVQIPFALTSSVETAQVNINIADMENGTVTTDADSYTVGDTVTLTVTPDAGYSQKLFINGEPLLLDWKTNTYSFVATEEAYAITGSFEPSLSEAPSDAARWDSTNQAHGMLTAYYPNNTDSWWYKINGEYDAIAVTAKNYLPQADSGDGGGNIGYSFVLAATLDNGSTYAFRIINEKENGTGAPRYIYTRFGASGSVTGWGGWCLLEAKAPGVTDKLQGDGAEFALTRNSANTLQITLDGVVLDTYTMSGVTDANKVVSVGMYHFGNKGQYVQIPFTITSSVETAQVNINIADMENGTVTTDADSYTVGDTVTLTVTPNAGYSQKLFINGEPLLLDWKTNTYSFVVQENAYSITGSFEPSLSEAPSDAARWDGTNQAHGHITTYYPDNTNSWWYKINGEYESIAVTAKNYLPQADSGDGNGDIGYSFVLAATLDNGKTYAFRIINEKENGTGEPRYIYTRYGASGSVTGWGGWCLLEAKVPGVTDKLQGDGAEFALTRNSANTLQITLDGVVLDTYTMDGVTSANKVISVGMYHYGNQAQYVDIPFALTEPGATGEVNITVADMENGTVITNKSAYSVGETVILTVTPNAGYSQKLFINGDPLLLDWKSNTYSFVATEEAYAITGSFVPSMSESPSDAARWDSANQAHGMLTTYYPNNTDAWWYKINGEYQSIEVTARNYLPMDQSSDGSGTTGYAFVLAMTLDNGKTYAFRFINEKENSTGPARYIYNRFGASGSVTGWGGWCLLEAKVPGITDKLQGDGAQFKLTRTGANTLQVTLDGVVLDTYTMDGVTEANKVVSVGMYHFGNKGQYVQIPFTLTTPADVRTKGMTEGMTNAAQIPLT